jgi:hypothetical protein
MAREVTGTAVAFPEPAVVTAFVGKPVKPVDVHLSPPPALSHVLGLFRLFSASFNQLKSELSRFVSLLGVVTSLLLGSNETVKAMLYRHFSPPSICAPPVLLQNGP